MSDQLRNIFARWQDIEARKAEIGDEAKDLFAEAKGNGYDTKALRLAFRAKVKADAAEADPELAEVQALVEVYLHELGEKRERPPHYSEMRGILKPRARPAPARIEIIEKSRPSTNDGGSGSYERPNVEIKAVPASAGGPRPGDNYDDLEIPAILRRAS